MNSLHLADYIRHGMIFKNLEGTDMFDAIVYERYENTKITPPEDVYICKQQGAEISSELLAYHHRFDRLLVIIDTTSTSTLLPFFEQIDPTKKVFICNLGTGVSGFSNKAKAEVDDLSLLAHCNIPLLEAYDFVSFFAAIEASSTQGYLRIPHKELNGNLFKAEAPTWHSGYLDLRTYGLTGKQGTIVAGASIASELIQATEAISTKYDCFLQTSYFTELPSELLESIDSTKNLILLGDYLTDGQIIDRRKARLLDAGITGVRFTTLGPDLAKIQANSSELIYEQAGLHVEGLVEKLSKDK